MNLRALVIALAEQHQLSLAIDVNARAVASEAALREAVSEIFDNCRLHGHGEQGVRAHLQQRSEAVRLELAVPTAAPLRAAELRRWFEPFYSRGGQGMGLGLYQARLAVEACGGSLTATPVPDGVAFVLTVPAPLYGK